MNQPAHLSEYNEVRERRRRKWGINIGYNSPNPLLKHKLTLSNGSHSSFNDIPVSAATCHIRAPSRCILMLLARANVAMARISSCGMMVPLSVFSISMTSVGAKTTSEATTTFSWISGRVRWCPNSTMRSGKCYNVSGMLVGHYVPFTGRTGMTAAPE